MAVNLDHQRDRISTASGNITINTAGSLRIPVGNTAARPQGASVATGQIRFNTQLNIFEGYNGTAWSSIGGVKDTDGDTFINAEQSADDDTLRFYTANFERLTISDAGIVNITSSQQSTSTSTGALTVGGGVGIVKDVFIGGNLDVTGNITVGGTITLGDDDTDNININADINSNLIPNTTNNFDIGSSTKTWKDLFISGTIDASDSTDAIILPQGTDVQRPSSAQTGMLRFSTTTTKVEVYNGSAWTEVGAGDITRVNITAGTGLTGTQDTTAGDHTQTLNVDVGTSAGKIVQLDSYGKLPPIDGSQLTGVGTVTEAFKSIAVSGQSNVVADSSTDTVTFVAGNNITLSTDPSTDSITINSTASGSVTEAFKTIAVSGQSDVVADSATDILTLVAGPNMTISTNAAGDTITFASSGGGGGGGGGDITGVNITASTGLLGSQNTTTGDHIQTLSVDVGTTANKIVQLDGSGRLPALDGSQLTNLPSSGGSSTLTGLTDTNISSAIGGQHLQWNGSNWENTFNFSSSGTTFLSGFSVNRFIEYRNRLITIGSISSGDTVNFPTTTGSSAAIEWQVNNPGTDFVANITPGPLNINRSQYFRIIIDNTTGATKGSISGIKRNGTTQTVNWLNGAQPSVTGSNIYDVYDIYCFRGNGGSDETWYAELLTAGAGTAITVQDEGSSLSTAASVLNFVGAGVTATGTGATKTITIAGGGGGGGSTDAFKTISVAGQSDVIADNSTDILTLVAGSGMSLSTNAPADSITFVNDHTTFSSLTDTNISSAISGQHLLWNGSNWENTFNFSSSGTTFLSGFKTNRFIEYRNRLITIGSISSGDTVNFPTNSGSSAAIEWQVNNPGTDFVANITPGPSNINTSQYFRIIIDNTTGTPKGSISGIKRNGTIQTVNWLNGSLPSVSGNNIYDVYDIYCFRGNGGSDETWYAELLTVGGGGGASDAFKTISVAGQSDVIADSSTDTLTLVAGSNMTITTNAAGDTITFASSGGGGGGGASVSYQNNAPTTGLSTGDLWFDTGTTGELYVYTGSEWISTTGGADAAFIQVNFTGNGSNQSFDTQAGQGTVSMVFLNGVLLQRTNDYTESNGIVSFVNTPLNGDQIDVVITGEVNALTLPSLGLANHSLIVVDASGNVTVDSLKVSDLTDNRIVIAGTAGELEDDANFTFDGTNMVVSTTGAIQVPNGTTAQRPSAVTGQFRFNSTLTQFEGYDGSAWGKIGGGDLSIAGDSGTDSLELGVDTLTVNSGTGLTTTVTNNTVTIVLDNTAVTPASYGSGSAIPVLTIDAQGRITSASTASVNIVTTTDISGDSGTDTITLGTDTLNFEGDTGITTTVSNNKVSIDLDDTAVTPASYGSTTAIPVITVDQQGRITAASTASLSVNKFATITVTDTASGTFAQTGSVSAASDSDTLTFVGGTNVDIDINTTSKTIKIDAVPTSAYLQHTFTGDNTTTVFNTSNTAINDTQIFINGVLLADGDYSVNTGTGAITFGVAPLLNDEIVVYAFTTDVSVFSLSSLGIANHDKITVDSSGNITMTANAKISNLADPTSAQDAATKAYVDAQLTAQDLDIAGDGGTGAVDLDSQSLTIAGTTNEIETSASGQTITIGLPSDVTIGNDLTVSNDATITGGLTVDTNTLKVDKANNRVGVGIATPLEKLHVDGAIRIDGVSNLETVSTSLSTTTQSAIDTFATTKFRSCKYTVQATDTVSNEYQVVEVLLIHDGTTAYVTTYGVMFTGSAEIVAFDADVNSGNVRLLATGASANSTQYKVTRISTLV